MRPHASSSELSPDGHFSALLWSVSSEINDKGFCNTVEHWHAVAKSSNAEVAAVRVRTMRFYL